MSEVTSFLSDVGHHLLIIAALFAANFALFYIVMRLAIRLKVLPKHDL